MAEIEVGVFLNQDKGPEHQVDAAFRNIGEGYDDTRTQSLLAHCRRGCAVGCG
jgi:hypothetical protein